MSNDAAAVIGLIVRGPRDSIEEWVASLTAAVQVVKICRGDDGLELLTAEEVAGLVDRFTGATHLGLRRRARLALKARSRCELTHPMAEEKEATQ